jgi:hypothetical protein
MSDLPLDRVLRHFGDSERGAAHPLKWKAKYGAMEVSDAKRLKGLKDENRRLRKLLAEAMLDNAAVKGLAGKKRLKPEARRTAVARLIKQHGLSQRRACRLVGIDHATCAIGAGVLMTVGCAGGYASWPGSGDASALSQFGLVTRARGTRDES